MKSYGQLWAHIVASENLLKAWGRVRKGHARSPDVHLFESHATNNLEDLRREMTTGVYQPGKYAQFRIRDPKPRTISCAPVRDRVVHHALCAVIAPFFEQGFTEDSYACREGKGTHRACARARELVRMNGWWCKMDVRHYFDSIRHDRLLAIVLPKFREKEVRDLITRIVRHPFPGQEEGYGLPIGNLTSQWFANAYLSGFDHYVKETLRLPGYIRYMDDMVMFTTGKAACWLSFEKATRWLAEERGLLLKSEVTQIAPVSEGLPFLGLRIFPSCWRLQRSRFLRTRRKFSDQLERYHAGALHDFELQACLRATEGGLSWFGFKRILQQKAIGEKASSGSNRVNRGGSWYNNAQNCRSANRNNNDPSDRNNNLGFRLASTMPGQSRVPSDTACVPRDCGNEHVEFRTIGSRCEHRAER